MVSPSHDLSDAALVKSLPGFENGYAEVNGTRLHYVTGGTGTPLVLLPGHPETWWAYHKVMPALTRHHRLIVVDLRGMGGSDKPLDGYEKKVMARDIYELAKHLGHEQVNVAGHDVGSMVAFSFAANHPQAVRKLALLDVAHPDESFNEIRMLPEPERFGEKIDRTHPVYTWWFAFHQVKGLPEKLLGDGRFRFYLDWLFDYMLHDPKKVGPFDRDVFAAAYTSPDAIRAGHAWYRAFPQDIIDGKSYPKLTMPVLGLGAELTGYTWLQVVAKKAENFRLEKIERSGHFLLAEQPELVARLLTEFFA